MNQSRYSDIDDLDLDDLATIDTPNPFENLGTAAFEQLLSTGLKGYLLENRGAWAFGIAADFIVRPGSLPEGLNAFYKSLAAPQQNSFREAVANVLASLPAESVNVDIARQLLMLAPLLPAPEILRVLPGRLGSGFFGTHSELFESALFAVARLAAPRKDALECLHALITSRHFDSAYAGIALLALCQADNASLVAHIGLLRQHLHQMFPRNNATAAIFHRTWAGQLLEVMSSKSRIAATLPRLKYFDRNNPAGAIDTWLLDGLFGGRTPHLRCVTDSAGKLAIVSRDGISHAFPISFRTGSGGDLLEYLRRQGYIDRIDMVAAKTKRLPHREQRGTKTPEVSCREKIASLEKEIGPSLLGFLVAAQSTRNTSNRLGR